MKRNLHELASVSSVGASATLTFQCCSCGAGLRQSCICSQIGHFIGRPLQCRCGAVAQTGDSEFLRKQESKF